MRSLEKRIQHVWAATSILTAGFLAGLIGVVQVLIQGSFSLVVLTISFGLFVFTGVLYSILRYRNWGFEMRDDYLYLEHGVIRKVKTKVPYVRVQHVDTQRGLVDRIAGLSSLVVYTAGSRGADVGIPGLLPEDADEIQEELRKVAVESEEEFGDAV
jgi:membrane protein YdbS with pleckstrin-like domain